MPNGIEGASTLLARAQRSIDLTGTRTVGIFPAGSGGNCLGLRTTPGQVPDGANSLAVLADGSVAILDTLNREVCITRRGVVARRIALPDSIYPVDIIESNDSIYVADPTAGRVFELRRDGWRSLPLPERSTTVFSGLAPGQSGSGVSILEQDNASYGLKRGRVSLRSFEFPDGTGDYVRVGYSDLASLNRHDARVVLASGAAHTVNTRGPLGSVVPLGSDDTGNAYFAVSELAAISGVDLTVRRLAPDGTLTGMARVPIRGRSTNPTHAVAIGRNGDAFALLMEANQTRLLQLDWSLSLPPLSSALRLPFSQGVAAAASVIPGSRANTVTTANSWYYGISWIALAGNLTGCGGTLPPYLVGPGTYHEQPYKWGGNATYTEFIDAMNAGLQAGNLDTVVRSCSAGVDCSGFIGECWGLTTKYSDIGLRSFCTNIAIIDPNNGPTFMNTGDIYDWYNQHVRMHYSYPVGLPGVNVYEATAANGGRVCLLYYSWASMASYEWGIGNFLS